MAGGGEYRKIPEDVKSPLLEELEKEIKKEKNKVSINLPEKIGEGTRLLNFKDAVEMKVKPENMVLYSVTTGILRYQKMQRVGEGVTYYHYAGNKKPAVTLVISLNENLNQATIIELFDSDEENPQEMEAPQKNELTIEEMEEAVAEAEKVSFRLDENIKPNYDFQILNAYFTESAKGSLKKFNPNDIVFYSEKFGILLFDRKEKAALYDDLKFYWSNEEKSVVLEIIFMGEWEEDPFYLKSITENGIKTTLLSTEEDDEGKLQYQESKTVDGKTKIIRDYRA